MTAAVWIIAVALVALVLIAGWRTWVWATTSNLDRTLSDMEAADNQRPYGQGVTGTPIHAPINGSSYDDIA